MVPRVGLILVLALLLTGSGQVAAATGDPVDWLRAYVAIDTSNPPGNEQRAASYLGSLLHRAGIPTRLLVTPEGRVSLFARLVSTHPVSKKPEPEAGALLLLHHMDVVPAGKGWTTGPFAAEVHDGSLWGRGAIDAKSLGIAQLAAFLDLAQHPEQLRRDVIFLAVADEERGGRQGTGWLLEHHAELFQDVAAVFNEGGSARTLPSGLRWWGIEVAQKRPLWLKARAWGRGGHGATINLHTATHRLIRGLGRIIDRPLEFRVTAEARRYFEAVAPLETPAIREIFRNLDSIVESESPASHLAPGLPSYLLDSVQVNVLESGEWINVAAEEATAWIDARLLPDTDRDQFLADLSRTAGPKIEFEVILEAPPVAPSPTDTKIYRILEDVLQATAPVVPAFIPGITDSRYFRQRGIAAYGFSPFIIPGPDMRGIHGADEHIPLAAFKDGVEVMRQVVRACATQ